MYLFVCLMEQYIIPSFNIPISVTLFVGLSPQKVSLVLRLPYTLPHPQKCAN